MHGYQHTHFEIDLKMCSTARILFFHGILFYRSSYDLYHVRSGTQFIFPKHVKPAQQNISWGELTFTGHEGFYEGLQYPEQGRRAGLGSTWMANFLGHN